VLSYWVAGGFAGLAFLIQLWQFAAALRFPLHRRVVPAVSPPAVSVLKPIRGTDPELADNLRSWLTQDYRAPVQILFGVHTPEDPACDVIRRVIGEFPGADTTLVVCAARPGPNGKVCTLAQLEGLIRHDLVVVSDADVRVPPDLLGQLVTPMADPRIGLVNCFYRMTHLSTAALRWEAVAVNADFWSQVLQARTLKPQDFALGAAMVLRRTDLTAIGGFISLVEHLADDYHLGRGIAGLGRRIELCPVVVECWDPPAGWAAVWTHQIRWARTIRVCQPLPYFASILANGSLWAVLWIGMALHSHLPGWPGLLLLGGRWILAGLLFRRMQLPHPVFPAPGWVWIRDLMGVGIWAGSFLGDTVRWRGDLFRVGTDGRLTPVPVKNP
jgi:ceramide glucosyltransferase